mmetsp:Transcript_25666/g.60140  ORF Transcript_25666/g.60140 Transcript_25666/m.60140 type:complete len:205 (+) Transcript_25666:1776-2390(+)
MEIRVGVGLRPGSKKAFALARSHVRNVFCKMRNSLLRFQFIGGTRKDLQVSLESVRGALVGQDDVRETVRQSPAADVGVDGQGLRHRFDLRIRSQPVQGRDVRPDAGVRRKLSPECRSRNVAAVAAVAAAAASEHVAEEAPLLVVLFVQGGEGSLLLLLLRKIAAEAGSVPHRRPLRRRREGRNSDRCGRDRPTYRGDRGDTRG